MKPNIEAILKECLSGRVSKELKLLYNAPLRETVPWSLFPRWAQPNDWSEGCHEG